MGVRYAVLSSDAGVRADVAAAGPLVGELAAADVVIVDRDHAGAEAALRALEASPARRAKTVITVAREHAATGPLGADAIVTRQALRGALRPARPAPAPERGDELLAVSLLTGPLDEALKRAADQIAAGFRAERCVISIRGDSTGAA